MLRKPKYNLIGVSGKARAGKDLFADTLNQVMRDLGYETYQVKKYADPLKNICRILTGSENWETSEDKHEMLDSYGVSKREFMQIIGTECIREKFPNAWLNATLSKYDGSTPWIITDVRFPNEVKAIEDRGGLLIRIESTRWDGGAGNHTSETALDEYPFENIVYNNTSVEDYIEKVTQFAYQDISVAAQVV